jgi:hypothetical protein
LHEKSALRPALEKWLGCAMNEEELTKGFTYSKLNGRSCTLTVLAALSENGNGYNKIVAVMPAGESALKPSRLRSPVSLYAASPRTESQFVQVESTAPM